MHLVKLFIIISENSNLKIYIQYYYLLSKKLIILLIKLFILIKFLNR